MALPMTVASCLPDISTANVAPFDAGDTGTPPPPAAFCGDGVIDLDAGEHCDPADAAVVGCTSCQVTCEGGLIDPATDHCYFSLPPLASADNAQVACENAGAHLVTFASEAEFSEVLAWKAPDFFWVGLQLDPAIGGRYHALSNTVVEPGWSKICEGCYAHVDAGAPDLPRLFPDGGGGIRAISCVVARPSIEFPWQTLACDPVLKYGVVCEREPIGVTGHTCNGGYCLSTRGATRHRYLFVNDSVTAQAAADGCKGIGTLVVFETHEEREEIARELLALQKSPPLRLWIGLSRVNGVWTWADGTPETKYPGEWGDNQPSGANTMYAWVELSSSTYDTQLAHADDGTGPYPYLCELDN